MNGFKIGIYFNKHRQDIRRAATEIRAKLVGHGLSNVQLYEKVYEKDDQFFTDNTPPSGYEITLVQIKA